MQTVPAKTIVTRCKSTGWFGYAYNMNIYRGCCHGCIYCDSRSDCYRIDDFDTVRAKENALAVIRDDLRRKVRTGVVGTGAMSDPYNPFEAGELLTRHALELLNAFGFGVGIATKSDLILRDIDILQEIRTQSPVIAKLTVTTPHDALSAQIEPGAPVSSKRLQTVAALSNAGIFAGILLMPVLPFIEDDPADLLRLVDLAHQSGARFIYPGFGVTLRQNQRLWYYSQLDARFPGLKEKYQRRYGDAYHCTIPNVRRVWAAFTARCDQYGILYKMQDIVRAYQLGYGGDQLNFFA